METAFVVGLVGLCAALLGWRLARKAGLGMDKPDCGCGGCAEKRKDRL